VTTPKLEARGSDLWDFLWDFSLNGGERVLIVAYSPLAETLDMQGLLYGVAGTCNPV